ncbi:Coiled-coil domain-containing protein 22-like protein [Hypsibius exemplaris]|uniref:Coiled-coil domain-containing protein 22 homolog n=1 Tax=Hypsibius exemplaris TaxID=2072580 RepID=A0A1W0WQJ2_HYPEX|nr:Coiled-coil domain-containing protein 22-like protein [Hypsibius exemplaris]
MAEVDGIVIQALRLLGCDLAEDVVSIRQFSVDNLVEAVSTCVRSIHPETPVPTRLSASMATKYRQASAIVDACKAIGYTGDLGYEAFLYGGESDMRKLLVFLVDKIPKEEQTTAGVVPYGNVFAREIQSAIESERERPWLPITFWQWRASRPHTITAIPSAFRSQRLSVPLTKDEASSAKIFPQQTSTAIGLAASIVEFNSSKLVCSRHNAASSEKDLGSRQSQMDNFKRNVAAALKDQVPADERRRQKPSIPEKPSTRTKPALPPRRNKDQASTDPASVTADVPSTPDLEVKLSEDEQVTLLQVEILAATEELKTVSDELKTFDVAVNKAEAAIRDGKEFLNSFENSVKTRKQVSLASVNGQLSTENLQKDIEALKSSQEDLHSQWMAKKEALLAELGTLRQQSRSQENSTERLKDDIRETKQSTSQLHAELTDRDDYLGLLRKEHQKIAKDTTRSSYTKRILEILANIKKQRLDIDKIIKDTRVIQKEINQLAGRLDRAFTETDELMFRDAKGDEFVRKAYKNVATFHESCASLIQAVEATGLIMREMKDLEDEVDNETKKSKEQNLERVKDDLKEIKAENSTLAKRLEL